MKKYLGSRKLFTTIIDGIHRNEMVEKLNLEMKRKPYPYQIVWLNDNEQQVIKHQCMVMFFIDRVYEDSVMYDVVPLSVGHSPWQVMAHDHRVKHVKKPTLTPSSTTGVV